VGCLVAALVASSSLAAVPGTSSSTFALTKSYALILYDPEGRGGLGVVYWVAYGIPASDTGDELRRSVARLARRSTATPSVPPDWWVDSVMSERKLLNCVGSEGGSQPLSLC